MRYYQPGGGEGANLKYHTRVTYIANVVSDTQYRGLTHRHTSQEGEERKKKD